MSDSVDGPLAIIMARRCVPGQCKTRLSAQGWCDERQAAQIGAAMARCSVSRLARVFNGRVVVTITPDEGDVGADFVGSLPVVPQGEGDLGARMARVWNHVGPDRSVVFFGTDSPDVPTALLRSVNAFASDTAMHDRLWLGKAVDGGFWALSGQACRPGLFANIDWGTCVVYDQMSAAAKACALRIIDGGSWFDVDHGSDVQALLARLAARNGDAQDDALDRLQQELQAIVGPKGESKTQGVEMRE